MSSTLVSECNPFEIPASTNTSPTHVVEIEVPGGIDVIEIDSAGDVDVIEVGVPGPQGPAAALLTHVDHSRPVAYVATAGEIKRIDYGVSPAGVSSFASLEVDTDWPNRASLGYA